MASLPPGQDKALSKPTLEFTNLDSYGWTEVGEGTTMVRMKTLADDPRTGDSTFLLHIPFGYSCQKGPAQSQEYIVHTFWEEVLILDGDVTDLTLNKTFGVSHYACRPPGMKHGPYTSTNPKGCTMFVTTRYE